MFYIERSVFGNDLHTNIYWTFEIGKSGDTTSSFWVGVQARNETDSQTHNNATFDRLPSSNVKEIQMKILSME